MNPTKRKKKIMFVITKSNWGGAQRYVYDLSTELPRDSFDVSVASGQLGLLAEKLAEAGVTAHLIPSLQRDFSFANDIKSLFALFKLFRTEKPDIVHLNSSKAGGIGALSARFAGVPRIIFTAHGWPFMEKRNAVWRLSAWLGSWATAILSSSVIAVSYNDMRIGKRLPFCSSKMKLIHNGIRLPALGSGEIIRDQFPPRARVVGTIGELTRNKNQSALIEQAKNDHGLFVAIVGEGEDRERLEEKIREYGLTDRVKLFGFLPAADVLRGFDTFALPSLKEGLPYVLIEARMAGLPIVANRVGGVGEILDAPDITEFSLDRMLQKTIALYH